MLKFIETDGGRVDAGFKGTTGDCVTRAIAIALDQPYRFTYNALRDLTIEMTGGLQRTVRDGVATPISHRYLLAHGWKLQVSKPKTYLDDLCSPGLYIAVLNRHMCVVDNGNVLDAWDSRRCNRTKGGSPTLKGFYYADTH